MKKSKSISQLYYKNNQKPNFYLEIKDLEIYDSLGYQNPQIKSLEIIITTLPCSMKKCKLISALGTT